MIYEVFNVSHCDKYTAQEKLVARKIGTISERMAYHRKKYLDLDVKKQSLISLLKGKYKKRPNYISK